MAREKARVKRKERKNISTGVCHVNASFNNTKILIADAQGNAIATRLFVGMLTPAMRAKALAPFLGPGRRPTNRYSHSPPIAFGGLAIPISLGPDIPRPRGEMEGNDSLARERGV